jgi:hypothetical protein
MRSIAYRWNHLVNRKTGYRCQDDSSRRNIIEINVFIVRMMKFFTKGLNSLTAMVSYKTVRIETHSSEFGGKVLTDEKSLDFFNVPKLHPTHRWKRLLPISVPVPSYHSKQVAGEVKLLLECNQK